MGLQISTWHVSEDDQSLLAYFGDRFDLLALPRRFPEGTAPCAVAEATADDLLLFHRNVLSQIESHTTPVADDSGDYHVYPRAGLCIEWTRDKFAATPLRLGRIFLDTSVSTVYDSQRQLVRTMRSIKRYIRHAYPMKTTERHPVYVGPVLAAKVAAGKIELRWPHGERINIAANG